MNRITQITFKDIAESQTFAEFTTLVRALTGIMIGIVDAKSLAAKWIFSKGAPLCRQIHSIPAGRRACLATDAKHLKQAAQSRKALKYKCHAGLLELVAPIYISGQHVATIMCGQILPESPSTKGFRKYARRLKKFGFNPSVLRRAYFSSPHMSPEKFLQASRLIAFIVEYIGEVGQRLKESSRTGYEAVDRAKQYALEHYAEPVGFDDVARYLGYSRAYLSSLFNRTTGESWCAFLRRIRLGKALTLLEKTSLRITDIAATAGFGSLTHFNRVFRNIMNLSPGEYRRRQLVRPILKNKSAP
jgi:AraC-like DNA-binding protein/ligand-binding sensor protein